MLTSEIPKNGVFAAICLILSIAACCAHASGEGEAVWQTAAERTGYRETGTYVEAVAYCKRLADASPFAHYTTFGQSARGRDLPLLILSRDEKPASGAAHRSGKAVMLIQNCIHAGECAGKDASLALARDIVVTRSLVDLIDKIDILIMPVFNVDGHERRSAFNRVNQNGPDEMGWRVTAANLNLNRDYTKADTVEMRHWLRLWDEWDPDLLIDNHTTDGSDHRYDVLYASAMHENTASEIAAYTQDVLYPAVWPRVEADGFTAMPYFSYVDRADPSKGIYGSSSFTPRFSTGYAGVCNRPSILVETHALKPFRTRVLSTYSIMRRVLEEVNRDVAALRGAVTGADASTKKQFTQRDAESNAQSMPLRFEREETWQPFVFKGVRIEKRESDIIDGEVLVYTADAVDYTSRFSDAISATVEAVPPTAYVIPPEWAFVRELLDLHGITYRVLSERTAFRLDYARCSQVRFAGRPFEGHARPAYDIETVTRDVDMPPGTMVVPVGQPLARLVMHLFEPKGPDSVLAWGFFNQVFEQKEYVETYAFEPIAREMLANDEKLKAEYDKRLKSDESFRDSPRSRINFLYERSKYWDAWKDVYPVARLAASTHEAPKSSGPRE